MAAPWGGDSAWTLGPWCLEEYLAYNRSPIHICSCEMFGNKILFKIIFSMILLSCIFFVYFPVENDPHFIIYLPKSQKNICFNIDSEPGKILNLVSDPELGKIKIYYIWIRLLGHSHSVLLFLSGLLSFPP